MGCKGGGGGVREGGGGEWGVRERGGGEWGVREGGGRRSVMEGEGSGV